MRRHGCQRESAGLRIEQLRRHGGQVGGDPQCELASVENVALQIDPRGDLHHGEALGAQFEHSAFGLTEFGCVHVADCGANLGIADACEVGEPDVLAEFVRGAL